MAQDPILDDAKRDELIDRAARWIVAKGLSIPATFLLEMHRPVAPLGSLMMLGSLPFIGPFVGFGALERFALLAEDRSNVERLIGRIAELTREAVGRAANGREAGA